MNFVISKSVIYTGSYRPGLEVVDVALDLLTEQANDVPDTQELSTHDVSNTHVFCSSAVLLSMYTISDTQIQILYKIQILI